jgi:hypothetical protein
MNPMDVKRKALQAVKGFGREGMGEELKKGYGKPAIAIKIESTKVEPEMGEDEDEMGEAEGMMPEKMMGKMAEGEMGESEMPEDGSKLTPEMLEMLLAKLGK